MSIIMIIVTLVALLVIFGGLILLGALMDRK